MQNNSAGMVTTSVPVAVVPNAPRCPSWKIHTSAPNVAVIDKPLSTKRFQRQHHTAGQSEHQYERDRGNDRKDDGQPRVDGVGGVAVDRGGPGQKRLPACGTGHGLKPVELRLRGLRVQRRAARDGQEGTAVADRGRRRGRSDRPAADECAIRRRHRRHRGNLRELRCVAGQLGGADPVGVGDDDGHVRRQVVSEIGAELITDLARRARCR